MDDYDDLDGFNNGFAPEQPKGYAAGLETLADGSYDFTILAAAVGWTNERLRTGYRVLRVDLRVEATAQQVQHTYFLDTQEKVNRLGGDCSTLGLPVGDWGKGTPLSQAIPAAARAMPGIRFKGTKKANQGKDGKTYHNLFVNARLHGVAPAPHQDELAAALAGSGVGGSDEIPF